MAFNKLPLIPEWMLKTDVIFTIPGATGGDGPSGATSISVKSYFEPSLKRKQDSKSGNDGVQKVVNGMLFFNGKPADFNFDTVANITGYGKTPVKLWDYVLNPDGTVHHTEVKVGEV